MEWMLHIEEKGLRQDYVLPENAIVDGVSSAFVVDIYGTHVLHYLPSQKLIACR